MNPTPTAPARRPRAARIGLVIAAVMVPIIAVVVVTFMMPGAPDSGVRDTSPYGHAALGRLLSDEDVAVDDQTRWAGVSSEVDDQTTVVLTGQAYLDRTVWQAIVALHPAQIVLIDPGRLVDRLDIGVMAADWANLVTVEPGCADPVAERSGAIRLTNGMSTYVGGTGCYRVGTGHLMVHTEADGVPVTVLPDISDNAALAQEGNAALAMQVIGRHQQVFFYHPDRSDPDLPGTSSTNPPGQIGDTPATLLPPGWPHAVALTAVAVAVIGLWRGRRLGPVLTEQLPSVVPAAETVEGHGRLYERIQARDTAAAHLRRAAISRLSRRVGRAEDTEVLSQALAERTGRPYDSIRAALAGPAPATDEHLVTLKHTLDALEKEAQRP